MIPFLQLFIFALNEGRIAATGLFFLIQLCAFAQRPFGVAQHPLGAAERPSGIAELHQLNYSKKTSQSQIL